MATKAAKAFGLLLLCFVFDSCFATNQFSSLTPLESQTSYTILQLHPTTWRNFVIVPSFLSCFIEELPTVQKNNKTIDFFEKQSNYSSPGRRETVEHIIRTTLLNLGDNTTIAQIDREIAAAFISTLDLYNLRSSRHRHDTSLKATSWRRTFDQLVSNFLDLRQASDCYHYAYHKRIAIGAFLQDVDTYHTHIVRHHSNSNPTTLPVDCCVPQKEHQILTEVCTNSDCDSIIKHICTTKDRLCVHPFPYSEEVHCVCKPDNVW